MTRVKICGLTNRDDALRAVECGADALGFVFAPCSRRRADPPTVARIVGDVPEGVTTVGVFQDQPIDVVRDIMLSCRLDVAQLHGSEDNTYMERLALPVLKAVGLLGPQDLVSLADYQTPGIFLLDAAHVEMSADGGRLTVTGGTGASFDWSWAASARRFGRIVLSGGLRPDNVAEAVMTARPWAVDTASGTECEPGRKDPEKLRSFVQRAKKSGAELSEGEVSPGVGSPGLVDGGSSWGCIVRTRASVRVEGSGGAAVGRLEAVLRARRAAGGKSFVPFFLGGYPDRDTFRAVLLEAERAGVDAIEVGVPSPNPALDGPVIRRASREALARGNSSRTVLADIAAAREAGLTVPVVLMSYRDVFLRADGQSLVIDAQESGVDGLLIVDSGELDAGAPPPVTPARALETVALVSPNTPERGYPSVLEWARGFVYCVSVAGGTGGEAASVATAREMVRRVRGHGDIPALVGFGITGPKAAREIAAVADGIIVGSALLACVGDKRGATAIRAVGGLLHEMRQAVDHS